MSSSRCIDPHVFLLGIALLAGSPVIGAAQEPLPRGAPKALLPPSHPPPETHGAWQGPWALDELVSGANLGLSPCCSWSGFAHAVLLTTGDRAGQVLFWDYLGLYGIWDPANPTALDGTLWFTQPVPCNLDIFCSGHTIMPDGKILIAGGGFERGCARGSENTDCFNAESPAPRHSLIFDPAVTDGSVSPWAPGPDMAFKRYYATAVTMTKAFDGRVFVLGGTQESTDPSSAVAPWERLVPGAAQGSSCQPGTSTPWRWETLSDPANPTPFSFYPRMFQLAHPDGRFLIAGETTPQVLTPSVPGSTWFLTPPAPGAAVGTLWDAPPELERYYGSAVLLHQLPENGGPNRVLVFGGTNSLPEPDLVVHQSVSEFRFRPGTPDTSDWLPKAPLTEPRAFTNGVVLPTGEIFISRGSSTDPKHSSDGWKPQLHAELYDPGDTVTPGGGSTRRVARIPNPRPARVYHAVTLLLSDGRVLVAGGDQVPGGPPSTCNNAPPCGRYGTSAYSVEVFEPPYLFHGLSVSITQAPATLPFGQSFQVQYAFGQTSPATIDRVVLIRPGSNTHHFDYDQRYIELAFTEASGPASTLDVIGPSELMGPPGYYMLFVVMTDGSVRVPSEGRFVLLE